MKLVYSFKSFLYNNEPTSFPQHISVFDNILYHIASFQTNKQWFDKTEFITDNIGKEILVDTIGLQFDTVLTDLQTHDLLLPVFGKIYAYSIQKEPFMHCDYDMFWFKAPPEHILTAAVACQNRELGELFGPAYNKSIQLADRFTIKPDMWNPSLDHAHNLGFLAANDLNFIREYTADSIVIARGFQHLSKHFGDDLVAEQYSLSCAIQHYNIKCETLFPDISSWKLNSITDINQENDFGYKHYFGHFKASREVLAWLNEYVLTNWPEMYYRALQFDK